MPIWQLVYGTQVNKNVKSHTLDLNKNSGLELRKTQKRNQQTRPDDNFQRIVIPAPFVSHSIYSATNTVNKCTITSQSRTKLYSTFNVHAEHTNKRKILDSS